MRALALIGCLCLVAAVAIGPPDVVAATSLMSLTPLPAGAGLLGLVVALVAVALIVSIVDRRYRSSFPAPVGAAIDDLVGRKEVTPMSGVSRG